MQSQILLLINGGFFFPHPNVFPAASQPPTAAHIETLLLQNRPQPPSQCHCQALNMLEVAQFRMLFSLARANCRRVCALQMVSPSLQHYLHFLTILI